MNYVFNKKKIEIQKIKTIKRYFNDTFDFVVIYRLTAILIQNNKNSGPGNFGICDSSHCSVSATFHLSHNFFLDENTREYT